MATFTAYPTSSDLSTLLTEAGFTVTGIDLTTGIAAGIARFERETGRKFLGSSATRTFDPPLNNSGILDLKQDLSSATTPTASLLTVGTLTAGTDYRFLPQDAAAESKPYNRIELVRRWVFPLGTTDWGALSITGIWAYGATIPADAWMAMVLGGAMDRLPQITTLLNGGVISWKEADISEDYGAKPFQMLKESWMSSYEAAVANYRRVTVGW